MKRIKQPFLLILCVWVLHGCQVTKPLPGTDTFHWHSANLYFLLVDRFYNGDPSNDQAIVRNSPTGVLRGFEGGDLRGVIKKLDEGYFRDLGVNVIWMTPIVEQIHGSVDESTGNTYGFHGYWTRDWTRIDPAYGTEADLQELISKAHKQGIRILLDAVINHTGPVTAKDPVWPNEWVRTGPPCDYSSYAAFTDCTLVENLPDIRTESNEEVDLPPHLIAKWRAEGRYESEMASLDAFFARTGLPRAPKYYIMKWLLDYIEKYGIDGYRVDTVKHTTEDIWAEFSTLARESYERYLDKTPVPAFPDQEFFLLGEVYGYGISGGQYYHFSDAKVNYFENGFDNLINFDFKSDAQLPYHQLFDKYAQVNKTTLQDVGITNYLSSHDDGHPFDGQRQRSFEAANKLLLAPGVSQIYYGDETDRLLSVEGAVGDANLRSFMNWDDLRLDASKQELLQHYQKLGQFRRNHPAIGAGTHHEISRIPYVFSRKWAENGVKDQVIVVLDRKNAEAIAVSSVFANGDKIRDAYSGETAVVKHGLVRFKNSNYILLLEKM
ncbi:MAG: alpha-amylase family glycosyl hydrolase [Weeksellaceae bacterium]|nr:alpha-amylase family glycosyl hydrolase [Weeksellaceae bacterium]